MTAQNLPEHLLREALDLVKKNPSRLAAAKNATRLDGKKGLAPRSFAHRLEVAERVLGEKPQDATKGMGGASKIDPALLREAVDLMNEHGSTAVCLRYATRADGKKGISPSQFRLRLQAAREELNLTPETGVGDELERLREENRRLRADAATTKRDELTRESIRQHIIGLTAVKPEPPKWLKGAKRPHAGLLGVPTLFCSDWHWGEVVRPTELGGVNEFNLEIAHRRVHRMVDTSIDLLRNHLVGAKYDGIVLILGGDMVSGNIHDELTITNELPIMPVIVDLYGILISVITRLADEFGNVFIPCVAGNHGRNTRKPVSKERWGTSFDWLLYSLLAKHFARDKRVQFDIPDAPDCEFRIYNHRYLLTHGDQFRGGDGLIGPLGPITRGRHKKASRDAAMNTHWDTMLCGHFHTLMQLPHLVVNGSLKGYDEYAYQGNFSFEQPAQAMWITHPTRGITWQAAIKLSDPVDQADSPWVSVPRAA